MINEREVFHPKDFLYLTVCRRENLSFSFRPGAKIFFLKMLFFTEFLKFYYPEVKPIEIKTITMFLEENMLDNLVVYYSIIWF